jgi:hypothetical protein
MGTAFSSFTDTSTDGGFSISSVVGYAQAEGIIVANANGRSFLNIKLNRTRHSPHIKDWVTQK